MYTMLDRSQYSVCGPSSKGSLRCGAFIESQPFHITRYNGCPIAMEQVKQFDFNESSIFGKFDLFCKRLQKLIELFTTVHQFSSLAKHNIEVRQKVHVCMLHVACCMLHSPSVLEPRKAQHSGREVTPSNVDG